MVPLSDEGGYPRHPGLWDCIQMGCSAATNLYSNRTVEVIANQITIHYRCTPNHANMYIYIYILKYITIL